MRSALDRLVDPADVVGPRLLGARLTHLTGEGRVTVRLTEVEAYLGATDPGSHAFRGRTTRTAPMFGPAGHLYVYFTYGMHWCANVVTGPDGEASACLLRAGEVIHGLELARARRPGARRDRDLARGPANLAAALGISGALTGAPLHVGYDAQRSTPLPPLALEMPRQRASSARIAVGPRVGVAGEGGDGSLFPLRFWLREEPTVSAYRPSSRKRRR